MTPADSTRTAPRAIDPDPLQYLNRVERLLVGWSVVRQFRTNSPRFAKWVQGSGASAAARFSAGQTFSMYIWLWGLPGVLFGIAGLPKVAAVLYVAAGVCFGSSLICATCGLRSQRDFRRSKRTHE